MKLIKYVSMVILFTFLSTGLSIAQQDVQRRGTQGPPPLPSAEEVDGIVKDLVWELTLTEDQAKDFEKVFKAHMEKMVTMRKEREKEQREKMEAVRGEFEKELSGILNKAQMEKFKTMQSRKEDRRRGPGNEEESACRGKKGQHPPCRK